MKGFKVAVLIMSVFLCGFQDSCYQVRLNFALKLHKGLLSLKLPLQFLSILALAANDPLKERKVQVKQFLLANIKKRRELLKCSDLNGKFAKCNSECLCCVLFYSFVFPCLVIVVFIIILLAYVSTLILSTKSMW